jgi:hypothetical protein
LIEATAYLLGVGALVLFCSSEAAAQGLTGGRPAAIDPQYLGSAMNLEEVPVAPGGPRLTVVSPEGNIAHILPTVETAKDFARANPQAGRGPLLYHFGPIMGVPSVTIHRIFWVPKTLQTGAPTSMSQSYINVLSDFTVDYPGHGIDNNNTQYFQITNGVVTYIANAGSAPDGFIDNAPYPASACRDPATPGNCISEKQIRAEILKVKSLAHWTAGLNTIFVLFTSSGEGSCNLPNICADAKGGYCAYHSFIGGAAPIIYANIPYGIPALCTSGPSPNHNPTADSAANSASHEITEAITDPLMNAWYSALGEESGDICNFIFGSNRWDSGLANQMWNGHFYELQMEYDNHFGGAFSSDPERRTHILARAGLLFDRSQCRLLPIRGHQPDRRTGLCLCSRT